VQFEKEFGENVQGWDILGPMQNRFKKIVGEGLMQRNLSLGASIKPPTPYK